MIDNLFGCVFLKYWNHLVSRFMFDKYNVKQNLEEDPNCHCQLKGNQFRWSRTQELPRKAGMPLSGSCWNAVYSQKFYVIMDWEDADWARSTPSSWTILCTWPHFSSSVSSTMSRGTVLELWKHGGGSIMIWGCWNAA